MPECDFAVKRFAARRGRTLTDRNVHLRGCTETLAVPVRQRRAPYHPGTAPQDPRTSRVKGLKARRLLRISNFGSLIKSSAGDLSLTNAVMFQNNGNLSTNASQAATPLGLMQSPRGSQGSSFLATLGCGSESLWDWHLVEPRKMWVMVRSSRRRPKAAPRSHGFSAPPPGLALDHANATDAMPAHPARRGRSSRDASGASRGAGCTG